MTTLTAPDLPAATLETLARIFGAYPELLEVKLFGSRAAGKASPRSDIDLAAFGIASEHRLGMLALDLEDSNIPQKCDLVAYETIRYPPFKSHIDTFGITIYRKRPPLRRHASALNSLPYQAPYAKFPYQNTLFAQILPKSPNLPLDTPVLLA